MKEYVRWEVIHGERRYGRCWQRIDESKHPKGIGAFPQEDAGGSIVQFDANALPEGAILIILVPAEEENA